MMLPFIWKPWLWSYWPNQRWPPSNYISVVITRELLITEAQITLFLHAFNNKEHLYSTKLYLDS